MRKTGGLPLNKATTNYLIFPHDKGADSVLRVLRFNQI